MPPSFSPATPGVFVMDSSACIVIESIDPCFSSDAHAATLDRNCLTLAFALIHLTNASRDARY
jgi:hypothetical protein